MKSQEVHVSYFGCSVKGHGSLLAQAKVSDSLKTDGKVELNQFGPLFSILIFIYDGTIFPLAIPLHSLYSSFNCFIKVLIVAPLAQEDLVNDIL